MSSGNAKLEKVKKSCHIAKKVSGFLAGLSLVATIICLVTAAGLVGFGQRLDAIIAANVASGTGNFAVDNPSINGVLQFRINVNAMIERGNYSGAVLACVGFGACIALLTTILFFMIRKIFVDIEKSESPFNEAILRSLKHVFTTMSVICALFVGLGVGVMVGLILWCFYCIMDYGIVLQTEVDDTI